MDADTGRACRARAQYHSIDPFEHCGHYHRG
jgi:hypothetical protein